MIVDSHVHILPDRVRDDVAAIAAADPWFAACHTGSARVASAESLIEAMDRNAVDRAICFTWPFADPLLCIEANDYLAAAQAKFPARIVGFGIVQPNDPGAAREVERCARIGLRGIGELNADAQGFSLTDQAVLQAVADASCRNNLIWNVHCSEPVGHSYPGKGTATPDHLVELALRNPELTLIGAHLGGGLPFYAHMPEVHDVCRRLWFDTAAQPFLYEPSAYSAVIDAVGADRLLFGSDHPLLDLPRYLSAMEAAGLSPEETDALLGGNALRLLGD